MARGGGGEWGGGGSHKLEERTDSLASGSGISSPREVNAAEQSERKPQLAAKALGDEVRRRRQ